MQIVRQHLAKGSMLPEEAILKLKVLRTVCTLEEFKQGVTDALAEVGCAMRFTVSSSGKYYRVLDEFNRGWIIQNALEELGNYAPGEITIRGLHYRLVSRGMTNSQTHYNRVKSAMVYARRAGTISFSQFSDHDRETIGDTESARTTVEEEVESSSNAIAFWLETYRKNRWENQPYYPEVFIEKKALIGVFKNTCDRLDVGLAPCKGYPSLTFLHAAAKRFEQAVREGKKPIILYFGDYDASGEDIPRSIEENLIQDFGVDVEVRRVLLMKNQVVEMKLHPAPTKAGES